MNLRNSLPPRRSLAISALVTAGPRKSTEESYELGEDAAGFCQCGELTGFWLADGTTSSSAMGTLSTRKLAQEIGSHFLYNCMQFAAHKTKSSGTDQLIEDSFHVVQRNWCDRFIDYWNGLPYEEREKALMASPKSIFGVHIIDWSIVFACGLIDSSTGLATIWHCGDCFGFFYRNSGPPIEVSPRQGRLFLRLRIADAKSKPELAFAPIHGALSVSRIDDIQAFVLLTDGVAKSQLVSRMFSSELLPFESLVESILSLRATMDDDRGMIYGGFVSERSAELENRDESH